MKITSKTLTDLGACGEAVAAMGKKSLTPAAFLRAIPRGDWLIWWLWNSGACTIEQAILLGLTGGRRSLLFAREQDRAVCVAAFDAAEAVTVDNNETTRSAAGYAAGSAWSAWLAAWSAAWSAAMSAARSAAGSAGESAAMSAAGSAWSAGESAARSAAGSAGSAAGYAAMSAAGSAGSAARSAARSAGSAGESAARSAEHLACANDMRAVMRTEKYKLAGKSGTRKSK